jgi:hypothetical protein
MSGNDNKVILSPTLLSVKFYSMLWVIFLCVDAKIANEKVYELSRDIVAAVSLERFVARSAIDFTNREP